MSFTKKKKTFIALLSFFSKATKGLTESSHRLEILQEALKRRVAELPKDSEKYREIREELDTGKSQVSYIQIIHGR